MLACAAGTARRRVRGLAILLRAQASGGVGGVRRAFGVHAALRACPTPTTRGRAPPPDGSGADGTAWAPSRGGSAAAHRPGGASSRSLHVSAPARDRHSAPTPPPLRRPPPHWLDRWPAASAWLASKARDSWMAGLAGRCQGAHPSLVGRDDLVTGAVAAKAAGLEADLLGGLAAAAGVSTPSRLDSRARAHAQAAALAGATVAVLRPLLRDDGATASILAEHLGSAAAPGARALLAAAAALSLDPYRTAARRLPALRADWGGAAPAARLDAGDASTTLTLPGPCVYASALEAVGAGGGGGLPFLAAACCSADASVLAAGAGRGVRLERTAWVGDGESACVLCVTRV